MTHITPIWEACGDSYPETRLLATIWVQGCPLHLEAREVTPEGDSFVDYPEDYEALCALYSPDGARFQTFEHNGRRYVAFAVPFSA